MKRLWEEIEKWAIALGFMFALLLFYQMGTKQDDLDRRLQSVQAQVDSIKTAYTADTLPAVKP